MISDRGKSWVNQNAWHGDRPYRADELIRIHRAAELLHDHAGELSLTRRYELLDLGCGIGPLRPYLPQESFCIRGVEVCREAALIAARNYDSCEAADVEQSLPFPSESFDGAHAGAILEHVIDWHAPLNHINRVLRPGGFLVVSVPNLRYWKEIRRLLRNRQPHWLKDMEHLHGYTPAFLQEMVRIHGFEVAGMEADRVNLPLLPDFRWVRTFFAGIGSVLILWSRKRRSVRVENRALANQFPEHKSVGLRSIEVPFE